MVSAPKSTIGFKYSSTFFKIFSLSLQFSSTNPTKSKHADWQTSMPFCSNNFLYKPLSTVALVAITPTFLLEVVFKADLTPYSTTPIISKFAIDFI